jgi:hypothetical protein
VNIEPLANHEAAVGLFIACYNVRRAHSTLQMTPAMTFGAADHRRSIAELIDAAEAADDEETPFTPLPPVPPPALLRPVCERPRFTMIHGGRRD